MDINELRENMNTKSDDELLGILTRRELYSPVQIDVVIDILKKRREGGRPLGSTPLQEETSEQEIPEVKADDPTALFKPEEIREVIENIPEPETKEEKDSTEEFPKISEEYINNQKAATPKAPAKKKKNTGVIVAAVISAIIIVLVVLAVIFRPGVGLFTSSFEKGNYENARIFYKWCSGSSVSKGKIDEYFTKLATELTDGYVEGKTDFETAEEKIGAIKYFDADMGEKFLEELNNADDAERLFKEGADLLEAGQYYDAVKSFMSIYKGYKKYDQVETQLEKARQLLKKELTDKMQESLENHDFNSALEFIERIKDAFENDPEIASFEDAIAEQIEAQETRNKSAEDFYNKGGAADTAFRDASGLTYPSKKILTWDETGCKAVIEYGTIGSKSQLAFALFADLGDGIKQIYSYKDAVYSIYDGQITVTDGKITITGKINSDGNIFTPKSKYTDVTYTLKFDGEKAYLG